MPPGPGINPPLTTVDLEERDQFSCREDLLNPIEIEEIRTTDTLEALRPDWAGLWAQCCSAKIFQSPDWLLPWWKHLGQGQLMVVALRRSGRLTAIAPFFISRDEVSGERTLLLLGTGVSDYLDIVTEPGWESSSAEEIRVFLEQHSHCWDICDWQQLSATSPLLQAKLPSGWTGEISQQESCPVLGLPTRVEELSSVVPLRQCQKLRYYRGRLGRLGSVRVEVADRKNFEEIFEAWVRLHRSRWSAKASSGMLSDGAVQNFHQEASWALLGCGVLRLYGLRLNDQIIAAYYGFQHGRVASYYLSGFDPALDQLSPGTIIVGHAIEQAIADGAEEFDFLRGQEEYKYKWGAKDRPTYRALVSACAHKPKER